MLLVLLLFNLCWMEYYLYCIQPVKMRPRSMNLSKRLQLINSVFCTPLHPFPDPNDRCYDLSGIVCNGWLSFPPPPPRPRSAKMFSDHQLYWYFLSCQLWNILTFPPNIVIFNVILFHWCFYFVLDKIFQKSNTALKIIFMQNQNTFKIFIFLDAIASLELALSFGWWKFKE